MPKKYHTTKGRPDTLAELDRMNRLAHAAFDCPMLTPETEAKLDLALGISPDRIEGFMSHVETLREPDTEKFSFPAYRGPSGPTDKELAEIEAENDVLRRGVA